MDRSALIKAMQATANPKPRVVVVPGWGTVYARALTVDEVEEQTADTANAGDKQRMARAAARVICDEKGVRTFDPADAADVKLLGAQPWTLLRKVLELSEADAGN